MRTHINWDLFISHAGEDKAAIAEPLYHAPTRAGVKVWFDKAELLLGDSLLSKVNEGLAQLAVVPSFSARRFFWEKMARRRTRRVVRP